MEKQRVGERLAVVAILGLFVALAATRIDRPGLQIDEALFVNAAPGVPGVVERSFLGIPVMLTSYSGALKSYLWWPIFQAWGISMTTIRLPAILLSASSLLGIYFLARRFMDQWLMLLLLLVLATSPAFIVTTKGDWGPVVLPIVLRIAAVLFLFRYLDTRRPLHLALFSGVLFLGIFDKLNFVHFASVVCLAALMVLWPQVKAAITAQPRRAVSILVVGGAAVAFWLATFLPKAVSDIPGRPLSISERFAQLSSTFYETFNGRFLYQFMLDRPLGISSLTPWVLGVALVLGCLTAIQVGRHGGIEPSSFRAGVFFLVLFAGTGLAMVLTPQGRGPHHAMMLWALPELAAFTFAACWKPAGVKVVGLVMVSLALVASQLNVDWQFVKAFSREAPYSSQWTPEIMELSDLLECRAKQADRVVLLDWGMSRQLMAFADPASRSKFEDHWPDLSKTPDKAEADYLFTPDSVIVVHSPGYEIFKGTRDWLLSFANSQAVQLAQVPKASAGGIFQVYSSGQPMAGKVRCRS